MVETFNSHNFSPLKGPTPLNSQQSILFVDFLLIKKLFTLVSNKVNSKCLF